VLEPEKPESGAPEPVGFEAWTIPGALDGERLDRAMAVVTGLSRSEVNRLLDAGRVRIARRVVTSRSRRMHTGEKVTVEGDITRIEPGMTVAEADVDVPIVYQDDQVVVVDKPAGLVVHPGAGNRTGTLVSGLLARFPDLAALAVGDQVERPGIVHRLDKGTSGLLVVARTREARESLVSQMASRQVGREYLTLVAGRVESDAGLIDGPLARSDIDPTRIRVQAGGRDARTRYEVERRFDNPTATTLLRCRLETGRTHQIRVHLASIGHPVLGDDRYGVRGLKGWYPLPPGRPFLHAARLSFDHPTSRQRVSFVSPTPEDLLGVISVVESDRSPLLPEPGA
jgi:23S rRNA pseudouridine1911/1915/1917 synthase